MIIRSGAKQSNIQAVHVSDDLWECEKYVLQHMMGKICKIQSGILVTVKLLV